VSEMEVFDSPALTDEGRRRDCQSPCALSKIIFCKILQNIA
jgi:hypothetical protein